MVRFRATLLRQTSRTINKCDAFADKHRRRFRRACPEGWFVTLTLVFPTRALNLLLVQPELYHLVQQAKMLVKRINSAVVTPGILRNEKIRDTHTISTALDAFNLKINNLIPVNKQRKPSYFTEQINDLHFFFLLSDMGPTRPV